MNVLILSAGYGSRLAPLTDHVPKPMVKIGTKTILEHQIDLVKNNFPQAKIFINTHHLAEKLNSFAQNLEIDEVYHEPKILGTGGPLYRLFQEGKTEDLLVMNCDNYHNLDLKSFVTHSSQSEFALYCIDFPKINSVQISDSKITGIDKVYQKKEAQLKTTFTGISWYSSKALSRIKAEDFSIVNFWKREASENSFPLAFLANASHYWIDIGTPEGLFEASYKDLDNSQLLEYIDKSANIKGKTELSIIQNNTEIDSDVFLKKCIILENTKLSNLHVENSIIGDGFRWKI